MTAIKNGFNYWDILFPIRKTLGRFMEIKLFDNYVNKQTTFKINQLNRALNSSSNRVNLVIFFVTFLKYKLFFDDFYKSLYSYDGYNKLFCFMQYINCIKKHAISSKYHSRLVVLHKSFIFKRFFNIFRNKFFEFIFKRMTRERVNEIIRLTRPSLTSIQKEKYNKRRRMKRLEKRSIIELAEVRKTYLQLNKKFNGRLSTIKTVSHFFRKGRHNLMIEKKINHSKIFKRFFSANVKKNMKKPTGLKIFIKFYMILLFVKFLKNVRFKLKEQQLVVKKNVYMKNRKKLKKKQFLKLDKRFFIVKRLRLMRRFKILFF